MNKLDKIRIPRELDKRRWITEEHKQEIKGLHRQGVAIREIARQFKKVCCRRSIQFILYPERGLISKALFKERRKDGRYYNREKSTIAIRKLRARKQALYKANNII